MFVTLFRHAERENSGIENPSLTKRGHDQARNLVQFARTNRVSAPAKLFASPRVRSQQTLEPLSGHLALNIEILKDLDERQNAETASQFQERIVRFLHFLPSYRVNIALCTHLDWIEESLLRIPSDVDLLQNEFQIWQPGQFLEFELIEGLWHYRNRGII